MKKYARMELDTVEAEPMKKKDAYRILGEGASDLRETEDCGDGEEEGYLVRRGKSGYWLEKDVFDFKPYDNYADRMLFEHEELQERILRLRKYIGSESFHDLDEEDQRQLHIQYRVMGAYEQCLIKRIRRAREKADAMQRQSAKNEEAKALCRLNPSKRILWIGRPCDKCPLETDECRKIITAGGNTICVL